MNNSKIYFQIIILLTAILSIDFVLANSDKTKAVEYRLIFFKEALSLFKKDVGRYPTTTEGLNSLIIKPENIDNWKGPYLNNNFIPHDSWSNPFIYKHINSNSIKFIIYSIGKNQANEYGFGDDIVIDGSQADDYKTSNFIILTGVLCLFFGIALDIRTIIWGYKPTLGLSFKSGSFLIPVVFYLIFIFTTQFSVVKNNKFDFSLAMLVFQLYIFFILPWLFDKLIQNKTK